MMRIIEEGTLVSLGREQDMSQEDFPDYFEDVWDNWRNERGPCFDCPNRDSQCRYYPKYGEGVLDAEIAFIAETPNETRDRQNSAKSRINREGEFNNTVRENPVPTWIKKGNRFPNSFFENISADFSGQEERGVYYTNIKKCADIEEDRIEWKNQKAKLHCERYLFDELESVNPDVVITFGAEATESLFTIYEVDKSFSKLKEVVLDSHKINSYNVIPSFHWSYLHLNIRGLDRIENKQDYWDRLIETINSDF